MSKITKVFFIVTVLFLYSPVFADTQIHLSIQTNTAIIYNQNISVTPCDSEGDGIMKASPYCALLQSGIPSDWSGLWINSINGTINNDGGNGAYWMWLANLNISNSAPTDPYNLSAKQYVLQNNDKILFYYNTNPLDIEVDNVTPQVGNSIIITGKELGIDGSWNPVWNKATLGKVIINTTSYDLNADGNLSFTVTNTDPLSIKIQKNNFIDSRELNINPSPATCGNCGGPLVGTPIEKETVKEIISEKVFDLEKAFQFLASNQKENGSFGEDMYTDWVALAFATSNHQNQTLKLIKYFGESKMTGTLTTDYERRAMALMSLGLNPYNTNGENYIKKIVESFDGKQFGDANEDNDDIFALIVLQNAGYAENDKIINDSITFILARQGKDGAWDGSVDMTGATIQALSPFSTIPGIGESLKKAREYLKQKQGEDGGWGNVSSTAWAIQGVLALGEKIENWKKGENSPLDYMASMQDTDGGIKEENIMSKIWKTAYTVSALSGKTWNQTMHKFKKQITKEMEEDLEQKEPEKIPSFKNHPSTALKNAKPNISPIQNTATVINTVTESPATKTEPQNRSWFMWLLQNIFGF